MADETRTASEDPLTQALLWESQKERVVERAETEPSLVIDVEGFEGPLDLLLALARSQKVDLSGISILALADQYLSFIQEARRMRLELAADYLVMEAMRDAAARLMARPRLGQDVFARGDPEPVVTIRHSTYIANLYDLLTAYASQRQRNSVTSVQVRKRTVWSLQEARGLLVRVLGQVTDWTPIDNFLVQYFSSPDERATVIASSFTASLEMVREGIVELRQTGPFAPLFIRGVSKQDRTGEP